MKLDVPLLASAIVTAVRRAGTENRPDLPADGWPAYWTERDEASVLLVSRVAELVAEEYEQALDAEELHPNAEWNIAGADR